MSLLQVAKEEPGERDVANDDGWGVSRQRQMFPELGQRCCSIERAVRHHRFLGYSPGQLHGRGGVSVGIAGALFDNEVLGANAAAVLGAATSAGVSPAVVGEVLPGIRPLPHRAEPVGEVDGVLYE